MPSAVSKNPHSFARKALGFLGLFFLVLAAFEPVRLNEFINIDDPYYIEGNPMVKHGFTPEGLYWAFSTVLLGNWNPVTWMAHMLDAQLFGVASASGHHVTSALYHGLAALILFAALLRYTKDPVRSFLAAAFFAIHPLRVESVAWASEKKDVVSGVWWMLTLLAYERWIFYKNSDNPIRAGFSSFMTHLFFALGLLSKPVCVTLPAVLLLLDYWPLNRMRSFGDFKILVKEKFSLLTITAVSALWTFFAQHHEGATSESDRFFWNFLNGTWNFTAYIGKMIWPSKLGFYYGWFSHKELIFYGAISACFLILVTILILRNASKRPALVTGWFWYLGTMLPMVGILQVGIQSMADRYTYIPQIGLGIAVLWGFDGVWKGRLRRGIFFGAVLLLGICLFLTRRQIGFWKTSEEFWRHSLTVSRPNDMVWMNLGMSLMKKKDAARGLEAYQKALEISPESSLIFAKIADIYRSQKDFEKAREFYEKAAKADPEDPTALFEIGYTYTQEENPDKALEYYQKVLELKPEHIKANFFISEVYAQKGKAQEREKHLRTILKARPLLPEEYNLKGLVFYKEKDWDSALWNLKMAADMQLEYDSAYYNLANVYLMKGEIDQAAFYFQETLRVNPDFASAANDYGALLQNLGRTEEAVKAYEQAIRAEPRYGDAYYNLGNAYASQNLNEEAIRNYQKTIEIMPDYANAHNNLAIVYEKSGHDAEALEHYRIAARLEPQNESANYNLANYYFKRGQAEEARTHYKAVLRVNPGHERAQLRLEEIEKASAPSQDMTP